MNKFLSVTVLCCLHTLCFAAERPAKRLKTASTQNLGLQKIAALTQNVNALLAAERSVRDGRVRGSIVRRRWTLEAERKTCIKELSSDDRRAYYDHSYPKKLYSTIASLLMDVTGAPVPVAMIIQQYMAKPRHNKYRVSVWYSAPGVPIEYLSISNTTFSWDPRKTHFIVGPSYCNPSSWLPVDSMGSFRFESQKRLEELYALRDYINKGPSKEELNDLRKSGAFSGEALLLLEHEQIFGLWEIECKEESGDLTTS